MSHNAHNFVRTTVCRRLGALAVSVMAFAGLAHAQNAPGFAGAAGPGLDPQVLAQKPAPSPLSAQLGVNLAGVNIPVQPLEAIDLNPIIAVDAVATGALREGIIRDFPGFDLGMGTWFNTADGGWLWVLDVQAEGAFGVRVHFADFGLPAGARAIVYDPAIPENLPSPYSGTGPNGPSAGNKGEFWAWTSWNNTARVEVYFPREVGDARFNTNFTIDKIGHMYRNPRNGQIGFSSETELPCHLDQNCYPNWTTVGDSVGRMAFARTDGFFNCSGSMLNNPSGDLAPFFLTALHCMRDQSVALNSLEVYWFYESNGCNGSVPALGSVPRSVRASYLLSTQANDMSLIMVEGVVPRNLWWNGVSWQGSIAEDTFVNGISHPGGAFKRIAFGDIWDEFDSCGATGLTQGNEIDWNSGLTEGGSSGSPLYLLNGAVVGVLSCDTSRSDGCSSDDAYYGRWGNFIGSYQSILANSNWDDDSENNDSCATARSLDSFFNGTLYSRIVKSGDEDWYSLTVGALGTVSFGVGGFDTNNGDIDITLLNNCGAALASSNSTTNFESVSWTNPNNFPVTVKLRVYLFNDTRNIYYLDFSRFAPSAPANDICTNRQSLALGGTAFGTTRAAAANGFSSCGTSNASPDVYYTITAPCTQDVTISTQGTSWDTVLSVLAGCPSSLAGEIACNDDFAPPLRYSRLTFTAQGGVPYTIRVSGYQGAFGDFTLNAFSASLPNDNCFNAISIADGTTAFNNCAASTDGLPDDSCLAFGSSQIYKDLWYTYIPSCAGTVEVNTIGSNFDTRIAVYPDADGTTCPIGANAAIACNDDIGFGDLQSRLTFSAIPGVRYIIRVGSYAANTGNPGVLNVALTPQSLAHDVCASPLAVTPGTYAWYTCNTGTEGFTESCISGDGQFHNDLWFAYTPTCNGTVDFNTIGFGVDTRIAVYSECPTAADLAVWCNDDIDENTIESQVLFQAAATATYYLRVGNWADNASAGLAFNLVFTEDPGCNPIVCDDIDFNNDEVFPDDQDVVDFFNVLAGADCPACNDIDFNNNDVFPEDQDVIDFFNVLAGGQCP